MDESIAFGLQSLPRVELSPLNPYVLFRVRVMACVRVRARVRVRVKVRVRVRLGVASSGSLFEFI